MPHKDPKVRNAWEHARRARLREEGMCIAHPNEPAVEGHTRCQKCYDMEAARRAEAKRIGMCFAHPNVPVVKGRNKCQRCIDRSLDSTRARRITVLQHYSGSEIPYCACCGESRIEFLAVDHINGDGAEHRKKYPGNMFVWLIKNNFPDGFQILCHNCNLSRGFYGYCPHEKEGSN